MSGWNEADYGPERQAVGGAQVEPWKPTEKGATLRGVYVGRKEATGKMSSDLLMFEQPDGEIRGVWCSALLEQKMADIPQGSLVTIVYQGKVSTPKGDAHDWKVTYRLPKVGVATAAPANGAKKSQDDIPF